MLKGISPLISPELLKALAEMGHGDIITLADAHYPRQGSSEKTIRLDGVGIPALLEGILKLIPLDSYQDWQYSLMKPVEGDPEPVIWESYRRQTPNAVPRFLDRFDFYNAARDSFVTVVTGETAQYGNIMISKGVVTADRV